jgi:hypothetical protein
VVEHLTFNQGVAGSIPAAPTKIKDLQDDRTVGGNWIGIGVTSGVTFGPAGRGLVKPSKMTSFFISYTGADKAWGTDRLGG